MNIISDIHTSQSNPPRKYSTKTTFDITSAPFWKLTISGHFRTPESIRELQKQVHFFSSGYHDRQTVYIFCSTTSAIYRLKRKKARGLSAYRASHVHWNYYIIPHPVASEHRWLVKALGGFTVSRMSRTGGRDVVVAMRDCGISTTSRTRPVCKHCFSALLIDKNFVSGSTNWIIVA